jgi:ribose/xylose/arabinose/galactoside ABC-type transport system permease subunit
MSGDRGRLRSLLTGESGLALAIIVVVVLTALADSQHNYFFFPRASAVEILRQTAMLGIFALGSAIVIIAGGIDLSSGSTIAFSGAICSTLMMLLAQEAMVNAQPVGGGVIVLAIAGTLVAGLLIGSLHTWLITVVGLPPFIATLATLVGLRSLGRALIENVTLHVLGSRSTQIQIYDAQFRYLATSVWIPVLVFFTLAAVLWLVMDRTVVGRHLYALGGNETAARLSGIRTERLKWLAYSISALTSALAGILYIGDQSVADPQTLARGYELNAIAAAVVGGCSLQGGVGSIPGTVLGCLFLRVVVDGIAKIIKTGADVYEGLIVGIVVVIAVAVNQVRAGSGPRKAFFPGWLGAVAVLNLALLAGALGMLASGPRTGGLVAVLALVVLSGWKTFEASRAGIGGTRPQSP